MSLFAIARCARLLVTELEDGQVLSRGLLAVWRRPERAFLVGWLRVRLLGVGRVQI